MIIITADRKIIINFENVEEIYRSETSIKVGLVSGGRYELGRYSTSADADAAMFLLYEALGKFEKFVMPDNEAIQAKQSAVHHTVPRHIYGKKRKGHGGS